MGFRIVGRERCGLGTALSDVDRGLKDAGQERGQAHIGVGAIQVPGLHLRVRFSLPAFSSIAATD